MINAKSNGVRVKGQMTTQNHGAKHIFETIKWLVVVLLLVAGIGANYYYAAYPLSLRLIGWLVLASVCLVVVYQTAKGKEAWLFLQAARTEMVMPGDNIGVQVTLIAPIAMEEGLRFAIREGGRTVGAGVVSKVIE